MGAPSDALASSRAAVADDDAFAIGARVTVPLHGRAATEALAAIESERLRASEIDDPRPRSRRRLPATDRRRAQRGRLTRIEKPEE